MANEVLIHPFLECDCVMWDPNQQTNIEKPKTMQNCAAHLIMGHDRCTESVTKMINDLNLETPKESVHRLRKSI